jgi:acetyl esterase/lipase
MMTGFLKKSIPIKLKVGRMKILTIYFTLFLVLAIHLTAQEIIDLYPGDIPNSKVSDIKETGGDSRSGMFRGVIKPTLEVYLPQSGKASGAAIIICPGGGYSVVVYQAEGISTAKEFSKNGIAAFVLKYRLPDDSIMIDKKIGPLQDAQQAVKVVRENASRWGIDEHKVGIMGFSAGGHLASTEATHFKKSYIENKSSTNLRPDFQILVYPVISMQDSLTHPDSRTKLLGKNPSKEVIEDFSNELQIDESTPPAYLTHASDDKLVDVDNSIFYFEKLRHYNIPVELHVYQKGGHGFIFRQKDWMEPLFGWMKNSKWINN